MLKRITSRNLDSIQNDVFRAHAAMCADIERDFLEQVGSFGLPFAELAPGFGDTAPSNPVVAAAIERLVPQGLHADNNGHSLWANRVSPACETCRLGLRTETFLTSTQCPRHCFFCFNPNQEDYEFYLTHARDVVAELEARNDQGVRYDDLALTGGEPLLHKELTLAFFQRARELYPEAYTRLYTCGAGLDVATLEALRDAGLSEIRFSIKTDDSAALQESVFEKIVLARDYIPHVMVEMPVMPDERGLMEGILVRLDAIGIDGINLLELCFPLHNAEEFARRGLRLKTRPYEVLYNYFYAGGLPIAGSEEACLDLLAFALERKLGLGVHYCSLENKFTGQIYLQNKPYENAFAGYEMSPRDHFLKAAVVFGADVEPVRAVLDDLGERNYQILPEPQRLVFPLEHVAALAQRGVDAEVGMSYAVVEEHGSEPALREVRVDLVVPGEEGER